jgi:cyclophilin family peptidyl-prolyl cis-trans isomerase
MKRLALPGIGLLLVLGCGGSREEQIIKKQDTLNEATAEKVEKARTLRDLKSVFQGYRSDKAAIVNDLRSLGRDKAEKLVPRFLAETAASQAKIQAAVAKLHDRLTGDTINPVVLIETSSGPVTLELFEELAPITVNNFLDYVDAKFYDGTIFHRVISTFMIQGGGFEPGMKKGEKTTRAPIANESYNGLSNDRGTVAMARTDIPDSATAQFFINVVDNGFLNMLQAQDGAGYAVFGKVTAGMDVVDRIRAVKTGKGDVPVEDVMIKSIRRVEKKK